MRVSVIRGDGIPRILNKLQGIGVSVLVEDPSAVKMIDRLSTDLVYLVPYSLTASEIWPELRVRFARSGRFYVVYGHGIGTLEIMSAARDGAHDVVIEADSDERWESAIRHAGESQDLWWSLYGGSDTGDSRELLVGKSAVMKSLNGSIDRLGPSDATVLLSGESGTGKELAAEALHLASGKGNFVPVNCAAIPKDLIESELFGVEKGAFTGAVRSKPGLVEEAAGGTLFLDEIGELDMMLQPKLLRFVETHHARRVGSTKEYECDVRVISATNRDLERGIDDGVFRPDLYYRLSEVVVNIPPLRHRIEDIPELATLFIRESAERAGKNFESLEPGLIYRFQQYYWPGNVRELKQAIDRMALFYDGPVMREAWWDQPRARGDPVSASGSATSAESAVSGNYPSPVDPSTFSAGLLNRRQKLELASRLLEDSGNDLTWVAAQLGIHPTTLYRWRKSGKV